MFTIKTYTDTKCELEMAKIRLRLLMDKKEKLYCKYFPLTSKPKEIMVDGGEHNNDKMADYVHELHEIDIGTGKSLADEIEYQQDMINNLEKSIHDMNEILEKLKGIEYRLYYEIVVNDINVSKAVEKIAASTDKDVGTIWKNYYPKIKKYVGKIEKIEKST